MKNVRCRPFHCWHHDPFERAWYEPAIYQIITPLILRDLAVTASQHLLIEKIAALSPQRVAEAEDFVDFLRARDKAHEIKRDSRLTAEAARASEPAFARVWDNDEDTAYDRL